MSSGKADVVCRQKIRMKRLSAHGKKKIAQWLCTVLDENLTYGIHWTVRSAAAASCLIEAVRG